MFHREWLQPHQRGHALRRVAGHGAVEKWIGKQQRFHVRSQLGKQASGSLLRRFTKKDRVDPQPAANRFRDDSQPLHRTIAVFGQFGASKRAAKFFHQQIMPPFEAA
jgi:hypothetical protein